MSQGISTAAVIGSGVMGSAIAAQLAGAGIRTHLLDVLPKDLPAGKQGDAKARNRVADEALARALKTKPAPFYLPDQARLVTTGNLEDHLERLREADLVIEAIIENLDIKKQLFHKIAPFLNERAILASNTSGLSIAGMSAALPPALEPRFLVMHFFNPVRYMHLLEIAPGPKTSPDVLERAARFGELLGKGIVYTKDTTNFVANRIGVFGMMQTTHSMLEAKLGIETVDLITGKPMARSAGSTFKTGDLVGLDTLVHVSTNCYDTLKHDPHRDVFKIPEFVTRLVKEGRLGRKSGAGFYKKVGDDILVLDYDKLEYRPAEKLRFESIGAVRNIEDPRARLAKLLSFDDPAARFAWKLTAHTLAYSAALVGEIADDIVSIDRALRWGFNWELGPFEAWDAIGVAKSVARMQAEGVAVPEWVSRGVVGGAGSFYAGAPAARTYFDVGAKAQKPLPADRRNLSFEVLTSEPTRVVKKNLGASLVDIGDGALAVEVHTKMNTIDGDVIAMLVEGVREAEKNFEALVIANDGQHFGAGANLFMIFAAAQQKQFDQIGQVIRGLQNALQGLRYAKVPVVAAPFQYTLGGGAELAMAADACQAHAETYMGLVELGVGLIPAGGGCLRLVERHTLHIQGVENADPLPLIGQASMTIAMAKVSTSAHEAKLLRYLQPEDGISLNRSHQLYHAKQRALGMARAGYRPPTPKLIAAAGHDAAGTIGARIWGMVEGKWASAHDALLANKVAQILCGGNVAAGTLLTEQAYLDLEFEAFLSLCGEAKSLARIQHMLEHNKPLRN
ncbi:MAG TPA: 3-hydroxyacyl-CoA dehydrogenase/enoyl-CoA hydratase family protein [Polyangiaceae bacterium]|nr:3-hydroxyacyl-CoA dehydrogenase/enoyl-CoA hydratase family protein [Polyangiaceae bacterium]